jgi:hypothetical protein
MRFEMCKSNKWFPNELWIFITRKLKLTALKVKIVIIHKPILYTLLILFLNFIDMITENDLKFFESDEEKSIQDSQFISPISIRIANQIT